MNATLDHRSDIDPVMPVAVSVPATELPHGTRVGSEGEVITPEAAEIVNVAGEIVAIAAEAIGLRERRANGKH
jgi:hypothetical protein